MDIVDSRVTTYLDTLYKPVTPELGELRTDSEEKLIPIILKDTEGCIKVIEETIFDIQMQSGLEEDNGLF